MANTLLTPKIYANTMLALLKNQLVMGKLVTTKFTDEFKQVGQTIYVKRPPEFVVGDGAVTAAQNIVQGEAPITIDQQKNVSVKLSSIEDTLTLDELGRNSIMRSVAAQLAQTIDQAVMNKVIEFPSWVGTPGQTINSATDFFLAPQRLDEFAVPNVDRNAVLGPPDTWQLRGGLTNLYQYNGAIANDALTRAKDGLPMLGGADMYMSQNVVNLTCGTRTTSGAAQIDGANQNVAYTSVNTTYTQTLNLKGLTNGDTIKKGEIFTIGALGTTGVQPVNPRSKAVLPYLQQFVVLADVTVVGTTAQVTIANPIIIDGAFQTVNQAPADSAVVTWLGSASTAYPQNVVFHKSAIALQFAKMTMPATGIASYASDPDSGVSIRYWRFSDGINDQHYHRWDILFGVSAIDRRLGTRISGSA